MKSLPHSGKQKRKLEETGHRILTVFSTLITCLH